MYREEEIEKFADDCKRDGFCILRAHFPVEKMSRWAEVFAPLLEAYMKSAAADENRGKARFYVTLPFENTFADETIFADADILSIVEKLVGADFVMCQLATDTPLVGSEYQEIHRDTPPLFPEIAQETPAFQLAVNFPLVDVTTENGAIDIVRATHNITKEEGLKLIETSAAKLETFPMNLGDVMIRDVRGLHRGTPNYIDEPRPMVVIGYSRKWLLRPEVSIDIPQAVWGNLSPESRKMLRFNRIVESLDAVEKKEIYQSFAF